MAVGSVEDQDCLRSTPAAASAGRLPAQAKILALVGFVCAVVAVPAQVLWPYLGDLLVLIVVAMAARLAPLSLLRGLAIEVPFVAFAFALPFLANGPTVVLAGLTLSVPGLWGAATLLAKSTLSVLAALILAATTTAPEFVKGLQRLHVPAILVEILGFMVRYLAVITHQWQQMAMAREARGFRARSPRAWSALSGAIGSGFIRAYERGERVHVAMLSRGYLGSMPQGWDSDSRVTLGSGLVAASIPVAAAMITATAWWLA